MTTGDGSSYDRRNPSVSFALTPNDVGNEDRCGMINAMEDADFVTLKPGESRKLDWIRPPQPGKPGRYTLRATYRNDPSAKPMRGGEPHPPTASQMEKLSRTVPCEVTSNALTFEWNGNSAKPAP